MTNLKEVISEPDSAEHSPFESLPNILYPEGSPRFIYGFDPVEKNLHSCHAFLQSGEPVGRFAIYLNPDLKYGGQRVACIGSYECVNSLEFSKKIITRAKEIASENNCHYLIGPMEGSTWNYYRFRQKNDHPHFTLEPYHHIHYNEQFSAAGFEVISTYSSQVDENPAIDVNRLRKIQQNLENRGLYVRRFDQNRMNDELEKIWHLCNEAFIENFLFTPIDKQLFLNKYRKILNETGTDFILKIEDNNDDLVALLFGYEDKNGNVPTLIIKSLARKNGYKYQGLGSFLALKYYEIAVEHGFQRIIHAQMEERNDSNAVSKNYPVHPYAEYKLYGCKTGSQTD